jgi:RNA polymerase sigma factor for flagellar operon FliA
VSVPPAAREAAIRALLPLVRRVARRVKRLVPGFELDDLVGDGSVGLIRAVDSFDPARGPSLEQYAHRLIVGSMLNGIRRMDPVSERARRIVRDGENHRYTIAASRGDVPAPTEMERRRPGYLRALAAAHRGQPLSLDAPLPLGETLTGDWRDDPARIFEDRSRGRALAAAIDALPKRQRDVVVEHYFGDRSLRKIGRRMAISSQRASQLHLSALAKLREGATRAPAD